VGDILTRINSYPTQTMEEFARSVREIRQQRPSQVSVLLMRSDRQIVRVYRLRQ
jgi:hypothetical protein